MAIFDITPKGASGDFLPLSGGVVTGTTAFQNTVSMEEATVGDLVVTGNATAVNNLQVNTINGNTTYADFIASGYMKNIQKTQIYTNEFDGDTKLRQIDFPYVSTIGTSGVANCKNLSIVSVGSAINNLSVGPYAFQSCTTLKTVNITTASSIGNNAFDGCTILQNLNLANITYIGNYAFNSCGSITSLSFPKLTDLNAYAIFNNCSKLTSLSFPSLTTISSNPFTMMGSQLTTLSFPKLTTINGSPLDGLQCKNLYFNVLTSLSHNIGGYYVTNVSFPSLTTISYGGVISGAYITNLSLPKLTTFISTNASYGGFSTPSVVTMTFDILTDIKSSSVIKTKMSRLTTFNAPYITSIPHLFFGGSYTDSVVCSAITTVNCSRVTTIGASAFKYCSALTTYSFPLVTTIGSDAFYGCSALVSANFPAVTIIYDSAFANCTQLSIVNCPLVTSIGGYAFSGCRRLQVISFPLATSVGTYAFSGCSSVISICIGKTGTLDSTLFSITSYLQSIECPNITSISTTIFAGSTTCSNISYFSFPQVTSIGTSGVVGLRSTNIVNLAAYSSTVCPLYIGASGSTSFGTLIIGPSYLSSAYFGTTRAAMCNMTHLILPNAKSIYASAFTTAVGSVINLTTISLPAVTDISTYAFYYCSKLTTVYLNGVSSIPTLSTYVFSNTITSIYVPTSLLTSFKTARNWSAYSTKMIGV